MTQERTHARARVVEQIKDMMTTGKWRASKSHRALAEEHGLSVVWVKQLATQAGHELHALMVGKTDEERDAARARILARMEDLREQAMTHVRTYVDREGEVHECDAPDYRAALEVDKLELETLGLKAPTKQEVTRRDIDPNEDPRQVREKLLAALAEVDKQLAEPKEVH